ncbi:MAG: hypothetical protein ACRDM7_19970 [Thermoleophilaceae bacterium]
MKRLYSRRPTPAMIVAFVALLAALSGTAVALPGKNTVDSGDLKKGAVKTSDLANRAVTNKKVKNGTLTGAKVKDDSLTGADINESTLGQVPSANAANSANTANSAQTANNATNLGGAAANDYRRYSGDIPSGKTITGAWGITDDAAAATDQFGETVQFQVPAPAGLSANQINFGAGTAGATDADATCTGSVGDPTAPAGKVCIYRGSVNSNLNNYGGFQYTANAAENRWGFTILASAVAIGQVDARGTWAYTAP